MSNTISAAAQSRYTRLILVPLAGWVIFVCKHFNHSLFLTLLAIPALIYCVIHAVHHAEVIAHRIGQPLGSLVLALAVTVIEVSLIISMMLSAGENGISLARDSIFAAIMILLTGIIGLCIVAGSLKYREQAFSLQGSNSVLAMLLAISVLTLVLPNYTESIDGPYYTTKQLIFVSIISVVLYVSFVVVQNFKYKDLFSEHEGEKLPEHTRPGNKHTAFSLVLLLTCLGAVILLAESLSPDLYGLIDRLDAPTSLAGIIIASIILLPEGLSAYRAARRNQLQTTLNLALGSALASICLTIPCVAVFSILRGTHLELGLETKSTLLFLLSFMIVSMSVRTGKTFILQGIVLLTIFLTYIFMTIFP